MKIEIGRIQEGFIRSSEQDIDIDSGAQLEFPTLIVPASVIPKESILKRTGRNILKKSPSILLPAFIIGGMGYLGREAIDEIKNYDGIHIPADNQGLEGIEDFFELDEDGVIDDKDKKLLINQYFLAKISFVGYGDYELKTDYSDDTIDFVREGRRSLIVDGISLVNKLEAEEVFEIDDDEEKVKLNLGQGFEFHLGDTYEEFLLNGIIDQIIETNNPDPQVLPEQKDKPVEILKDLLWLSEHKLPIEFRSDSYTFPDVLLLTNTSKMYQTLSELGYSIAPKIKFVPYSSKDKSTGWFIDNGIIVITNASREGSIIHEEGHHQADENGKFSQERFDKIVRDEVRKRGLDIEDEEIYLTEYARTDLGEDYAETFEEYFQRGEEFRRRLRELYETNLPAYFVVKAKFDFFREFFDDRQYSFGGKLFDPQTGDVFAITDPNLDRTAIGLREEPRQGSDITGAVVDGDYVRIIEGPVGMKFIEPEQTVLAWRVEAFSLIDDNGGHVIDYSPAAGWVWEIWLGEELAQGTTILTED